MVGSRNGIGIHESETIMTTPEATQWFDRMGRPITADEAVELLTTPDYPQVATTRISLSQRDVRPELLAAISTTWLGRSTVFGSARGIFETYIDDIEAVIQSDTLADAQAIHESAIVRLASREIGRFRVVIQDFVEGAWVSR